MIFVPNLRQGVPNEENWDEEDGNWWPIDRIKNIPDEYENVVSEPIASNASEHLIFLDFSMWSWAWVISCSDDETRGKVAVINGQLDGYVANTFEEFVELYTNDWISISQAPRKAIALSSIWEWLRHN